MCQRLVLINIWNMLHYSQVPTAFIVVHVATYVYLLMLNLYLAIMFTKA